MSKRRRIFWGVLVLVCVLLSVACIVRTKQAESQDQLLVPLFDRYSLAAPKGWSVLAESEGGNTVTLSNKDFRDTSPGRLSIDITRLTKDKNLSLQEFIRQRDQQNYEATGLRTEVSSAQVVQIGENRGISRSLLLNRQPWREVLINQESWVLLFSFVDSRQLYQQFQAMLQSLTLRR